MVDDFWQSKNFKLNLPVVKIKLCMVIVMNVF